MHEGYARQGLADYPVGEEKAIIQIQHKWEDYFPHHFFFSFWRLRLGDLLFGVGIHFGMYDVGCRYVCVWILCGFDVCRGLINR